MVGFYVAPTLLMLYDDFPALMVNEDLKCPISVLFQAQAGTRVEPPTHCEVAGSVSY